ncbi:MAG: amino acid adenylation domain-containing protein [Coxiellaceae bacterium]|nr:amino acid adenylation domain-containing protein [Coxiellaceae bacterium]
MDSEVLVTNEIQAIYPANSLQQGFIFHAVSQSHDDAYIVQSLCDYTHAIDVSAYRQAWDFAIKTYPTLRLCFNWDESPIQIITKYGKLHFALHDISNEPDKEAAILALQQRDRTKGFELKNPSLLRLHLIKQSNHYYTLLKTEHHSIADAWSAAVLLNQVHHFYQQLLSGITPIVTQDIAYLQAQAFITKHQTEAQNHWRKIIQDIPIANDINTLLTTHTKPEDLNNVNDAREITLELESAHYERLKKLAHDEAITMHGLVQFAWHKMLHTYTGDAETIVGTTVSGRTLPITDIEKSVGLYINTLPLVIQWDNTLTVKEQLQAIHQAIMGLNKYSFVNLSSLQKNGNRLFNSLLLFENLSFSPEKSTSTISLEAINRRSIQKLNYPLALSFYVKKNTLCINFKYDATYLNSARANLLLKQLLLILQQIPCQLHASHHNLDLLTSDENQKILHLWNATNADYPKDKTLQAMFEMQVLRTPNTVALVFEELQLTYHELNTQANQLAHFLHEEGLNSGELVALCLDRSLELIIAILGILKAGCAYVPIDPEYPVARISYVLENTESRFLLTQTPHAKHLHSIIPTTINCILLDQRPYHEATSAPLEISCAPTDLAYVIYTSGTTGNPKGVAITHSGAVNRIHWMQSTYPLNEHDAVLQKTPYSFDVSVWELLWAHWTGARIVIARPDGHKDPQYLQALIEKEKITVLHFVPSMLSAFTEALVSFKIRAPDSLRFIFCSGEALFANQVAAFYEVSGNTVVIHNLYGPTEASIDVTSFACERGIEKVYIGRPIQNTRVYILTAQQKPVPVGAVGELYLGGAGLARDYWHQPSLTEKAFIHNPFATEDDRARGYTRLYKTGDRARFHVDGNIEYLGRIDSQVKIRGFRIELGEIEQIMLSYSGIQQAVALIKEQITPDHTHRFIAAYYVGNVTEKMLRDYLAKHLPDHMIPTSLMALSAFPITANGKLNRKVLPLPTFMNDTIHRSIEARNASEKMLCTIWKTVLKVPHVKITDNFFDLGGDSIRSIRLIAKMQEVGFHISVNDLFKYKTILSLLENGSHTIVSTEISYTSYSLIDAATRDFFISNNNTSIEDIYPASHLQMGMLIESQKLDSEGAYHDVFAYTINHPFKESLLLALFNNLCIKHPLLRTAFIENPEYGYLCIQHADINIADHFGGIIQENISDFIQKEKNRALVSNKPGLFSLFVSNPTSDKFLLVFSFHHAITDGWSVASLLSEFASAYAAEKFVLTQEVIPPYQRVIQQERFALTSNNHETFWRDYLSNAPLPITDFALHPNALENKDIEMGCTLDNAKMTRIISTAKRLGVSPDIIFLSAYCKTLSRFSNQNDVIIGLVMNNRLTEAGGDKVFGLHLNTLPLRIQLSENSAVLTRYLAKQKETINSFKAYPYGKIRTDISKGSDIYTCAFNYMHFHVTDNVVTANALSPTAFFEKTTIPFTFHVSRHHDRFRIAIKVLNGFIDSLTATEFLTYLQHDLHAIIHDLEFTWILKDDQKRFQNWHNNKVISQPIQKIQKNTEKKEPRNALEKTLCDIWQNILAVSNVGIEDNFFELGGDSIRSIRLLAKMQSVGFYVSVNDIFKYKTIAALIENVTQKNTPIETAYVPFSLIDEQTRNLLTLNNPTIEDIYPASYLQIGMIVESQKPESNGAYHDVFAYTINHTFNEISLLTLFNSLCAKHALLRTAFVEHADYGYICVQHAEVMIASHFGGVIKENISRFIQTEKNRALALNNPGLFTLFVLNPTKNQFVLVFSFHHAITDGWSVTSLISEFTAVYANQKPIQIENMPHYQNVIQQERIALTSHTHETFWRDYLVDAPHPAQNLVFDSTALTHEDFEIKSTVDSTNAIILLVAAKQWGISPDIIFISAYFKTLSRFMNKNDVIIGLVMNNRLEEMGGDKVFGLHLNTLPLRATITAHSEALANYVSEQKTRINAYKAYPYGKIRADITQGSDIYTCAFNYMHFHVADSDINSQKISDMQVFEKTTIPFTLHVTRYQNSFTMVIKALSGFIDSKTADLFLRYLQHDLNAIVHDAPFSWLLVNDKTLFESQKIKLLSPQKKQKKAAYQEPRNALEKELCEIWQSILHISHIGITDNFFELGGDSIRSIRLIARMHEIGFSASVNDLFKHKTILALVKNGSYTATLNKKMYIPFSLIDEETKISLLAKNKPGSIEDIYPASYLQMGMLIASLKAEAHGTYHDVFSYTIHRAFNETLLLYIFKTLSQKHPLLRTAFLENADYGYVSLQYTDIDITARYGGIIEKDLSTFTQIEKNRVLPLDKPGLFSLFILNPTSEKFILAFSFHHAITDGWSVASLMSEFTSAYADQKMIALETIPRYQQMIQQERSALASESHKKFWQNYLSNAPFPVRYLAFQQQSDLSNNNPPAHLDMAFMLDSKKSESTLLAAKQRGVSADIIFLSAYFKTLSRFTNQNDLIIGLVMNSRLEVMGGDKVFGLHLNTLPLRIKIMDNSEQFTHRVSEQKIAVDAYKAYPYGKIRTDIANNNDLYTCAFNYVHFHIADNALNSGVLSPTAVFEKTTIPMTLHVLRHNDKFRIAIKALNGFIDHDTAVKFLDYLKHDLNAIINGLEFSWITETDSIDFQNRHINLITHKKMQRSSEIQEPRNALEKKLCDIWQNVLTIPQVGITDNFFELGGDSIQSIRLIAKMQEINFYVSVSDIFKYKNILELITNANHTFAHEKETYLPYSLIDNTLLSSILEENNNALVEDIYPSSQLQIDMLIKSLSKNSEGTYHDVFSYTIKSDFNEALLLTIFKKLSIKHPLLRTAFIENSKYGYLCVQYADIDLISHYEYKTKENIFEFVSLEKNNMLSIDKPGLFRLFVLNKKPDQFTLVFSFHHAIADGWSIASLLSEFTVAYVYRKTISEEKIPSYQSVIKNEIAASESNMHKNFWHNYLKNISNSINNLMLNPNAFVNTYIEKKLLLDNIKSNYILSTAHRLGVSIDIIFLSLYFRALSQLTNQNDIVIGMVMNNRLEENGGDKVFGLHLNILPIKITSKINKITENDAFILALAEERLQLVPHKAYPYKKLCLDLNRPDGFYNCAFNYTHFHVNENQTVDKLIEPVYAFEKMSIPLTLQISRYQNSFKLILRASNEFIDEKTANGLLTKIQEAL